jgi:serine/threonine protein kinase
VPKVIDFGIAKATQGRLTDHTLFTAFEQFLGTPAYMSPEQAMMTSLDIDTRSDIYSLGVLLYELLTGQTPFDQKELLAAGLDAMRRTIREKEPPKPSTRLSTMLNAELMSVAQHQRAEPSRLLHPLGVDLMPCSTQQRRHPPISVTRMILAQAHNLFLKTSALSVHLAVAVITRTGQSKRPTGLRRRANPRFDYQLHRPSLG